MAIFWERLGEGLVMEKGVRNRVIETWHTQQLPLGTISGDDIIDSCPPQYGQAHPDPKFPGAIVRNKRLVMGPLKRRAGDYSVAKVQVEYDSAVHFRFGDYLSRSDGEAGLEPFTVYIVNNLVLRGQQAMSRAWSQKNITIFSGSLDPDAIQHRILQNTGCWYFFRTDNEQGLPDFSVDGDLPRDLGFPALLVGGRAIPTGTGLLRVSYKFRTKGPVPAMTAASLGSSIGLPALGYLDEYDVQQTPGSASGYTIDVAKFHERYYKGDPLPTDNPYNPIP